MTRWFEDVSLDEPFPLGSHLFTQDEIVAFALAHDPQYFHIDPEAAKRSHFGGLIACGLHNASMGHRKMVDALDAEAERLRGLGQTPGVTGPSPGVGVMEFKAPVRPGDTIAYTLVVTGKRRSNSISGWGLLFNTITGHNQNGVLVYRAELAGFSKLRDHRPGLRERVLTALTRVPGLQKLLRR